MSNYVPHEYWPMVKDGGPCAVCGNDRAHVLHPQKSKPLLVLRAFKGTGRELTVENLDAVVRNFKGPVPLMDATFETETHPARKLGEVTGLRREGNDVLATISGFEVPPTAKLSAEVWTGNPEGMSLRQVGLVGVREKMVWDADEPPSMGIREDHGDERACHPA